MNAAGARRDFGALPGVYAWRRRDPRRAGGPRRATIALLCGLAWLLACAPAAAVPPASAPAAPPVAGRSEAPTPPSADAAAPTESVRVGYSSLSVTSLPAWVAQDTGTFAKHGLEVALDYVPSGTTLIQNMLAGGTDFGFASAETAIAAALAGAPLVILAPGVDRLT